MIALWIGAVTAALILASPAPATTPPTPSLMARPGALETLLERHANAIGLVPDAATWSGQITQGDATISYSSAADRTGRYRTVYTLPYGERSEGSDEQVAWTQDVNGNVISQAPARRRSLATRLIGYNAALYDASLPWTLDGSTQLDGKQVYRLRTKLAGYDATFYVDVKTALVDGVDIASQTVRYPAYARFGPLTLPSTTVESENGVSVTTTVTDVKFSARIDISFAPPPSRLPDFPAGQTEVALTFESPRSLIVVGGSVNGKPVKLLLDSGSSTSLIDLDAAKSLGLPTSGSAHVAGASLLTGSVARAETLDLGGLRFHPFLFEAVPLGLPPSIRGYGIQGILGYDVLAHVVARIDYARGRLRLILPSSFTYAGNGTVIPLDADSRVPRIAATLGQNDAVNFTVDTGSDSGLIIYNDFAQAHARDFMRPGDIASMVPESAQCAYPPCPSEPSQFFGDLRLASGAGGNIHVKTALVQHLGLGKFGVEHVFTEIVLQPTGAFVPTQSDGLLGAGVLAAFDAVFLDYSGGRLILER